MASITLTDVTKRFGATTAVDDLSLSVADGETLGLVGPSGCGKTTTLRMVAGFETPTSGRVAFGDDDVTHVPPERRNVGLVFQSYALFDNMTVRQNVEFGPKMRGVGEGERRQRADDLLALLDIADLADRDPTTLSGGQQQRVGLARALAIEPRVLLLDEPMTGLDARLKDRLQTEMGGLLDDLGVTAVYVTHDQEEAMRMCDRIAVMNEGRIEQVGTPAEVYESPATPFVADFVGTSNLLTATADDGALDFGFETVAADLPDGLRGEVTVSVRPSAFEVRAGSLPVDVADLDYLGDRRRLTGTLPDGQPVTLETAADVGADRGETVRVAIDASGVHVIDRDGEREAVPDAERAPDAEAERTHG